MLRVQDHVDQLPQDVVVGGVQFTPNHCIEIVALD
jgi:hypothetical protein